MSAMGQGEGGVESDGGMHWLRGTSKVMFEYGHVTTM